MDEETAPTPTQAEMIAQAMRVASKLSVQQGAGEKARSRVPLGAGLISLPRKMVEHIRANDYVNFPELPPVKGKARSVSLGKEDQ